MTFLLKLVWRDLLRNRALLAFTLLAITASACLIVWFVASIDLNSFADDNGKQDFYGAYSLALCADRQLNYDVTETVHTIPGVLKTSFARQTPAQMKLLGFKEGDIPSGMGDKRSPVLQGMTDATSPFELETGRWFLAPGECVVGTAAEQLLTAVSGKKNSGHSIKVGDKISIETPFGNETLTVVGTFKQDVRIEKTRNKGNSTFSMGFGMGIGGGRIPAAQPKQPTQKELAKNNSPEKGGASTAQAQQQPRRRRRNLQQRTSPDNPAVYVSMGDVIRLSMVPGDSNIMFVQLEKPEETDDFYKKLEEACGATLEELGIRTADTRPRKPDAKALLAQGKADEAVIGQAWSTIGIVILASIFIIFTTLSMSVSEKARQLAMLRTIGFTKAQVASFILLEGAVLGILGWLGGILSGWLLITILLRIETGVFPLVTLSPSALFFAFACSTLGALASAIIPAWRATRIAPAESMQKRLQRFSNKQVTIAASLGVVFLILIPILVFKTPFDIRTRLILFSTFGTLMLGAGFLLVIPCAAVFTEKFPGKLVARLLCFNPRFLAQILSGNQWRTIGTTVALSVGLGLFSAIYIWSFSMLTMFTVPNTVPDVIVRVQEAAISDYATEAIAQTKGIKRDMYMEMSVAQPDVTPELSQVLLNRGSLAANVVCLGIDQHMAWRDDNPMLRLKFIDGSPKEARIAFSKHNARVCVIPETLAVNANLNVGDTIKLKLPHDGKRPQQRRGRQPQQEQSNTQPAQYAEYTIVGIVDFAWTWLSKCAGVRVSAGRTSALVFMPYQAPIMDFGAPEQEFFWFDKDTTLTHADLETTMRTIAGNSFKLNQEMRGERRVPQSYSGGTIWDSGLNKHHVMVSSNESLNNSLNFRSFNVIDAMAQMPIIVLILSSIAIVNTMVVSVRSRRWELGVIRACGVTRCGLARIIFAEAILIGICAMVVSFAFGLYYSWLTTQMIDLAPMFGVIAPPLTIPWSRLLPGYALTLALAALAGIFPALATGMKDVATLLQRRD